MAANAGIHGHPLLDAEELTKLKVNATKALQQRRYDLAAGLFRRLMDAEPDDGTHAQRLGDAFVRLGCRRAAVEAYRTAAECYARSGATLKGVRALELVLALHPTDSAARENLARVRNADHREAVVEKTKGHETVWDGEQMFDGTVLR